jgi:hypothetical protein
MYDVDNEAINQSRPVLGNLTYKLKHDYDSYQNILRTTDNVFLIITTYTRSIAPL